MIIVVLFAALIGPYFINWTEYRSTFEREATRYFGRTVTVVGKADLRILPTPTITFTDVRLGDPEEPDIVVERFHTMVELAPLLKGEIRVLEMRVERPNMQIDLARLSESATEVPPPSTFDLEKVSLSQVEITQGEATIVDSRTGDNWILSGINAVVEARSLLGPASFQGGLVFDGERFDVRAAAGRRTRSNSLPLNITVSPETWPLALSADGQLVLEPDQPPLYRAAITIGARPPGDAPADDETEPAMPYGLGALRLVGAAEITPQRLSSEEFLIVYGPADRPLQMNGKGVVDFGTDRRFDIALTAQQINLDRILGGGPDDPVAITEAMATLSAVARRLPRPTMPGSLSFAADGLVASGSVVQNISASLAPDAEGGWSVSEFSAALPGETTVEARGRLVGGPAPGFEGWGRIASERPAALSAWWRSESGSASRIGPFSAEANVAFSAASRVADNIVATTGDGTIRGMVAARNFAASNDVFVTVELESDRFDLDRARALVEVLGGDLVSAGNINRISIDLGADVLVAGGIEARAVTIEGDYEDQQLDLRRLTVADLAGARVEARGRIRDLLDSPSGRFDATLKADDLSGTALFFAGLLPGNSIVEHFGRIAPALAPVDADLSIQAGEPDVDLAVDIGGNFAGTRISLSGTGSGRLSEPASLTGSVNGLFVGTDTSKVLAQIGLPVLPIPDLGPARLTVALDGSLAEGAALRLQAEAAGTGLEFDGTAAFIDGEPGLDGTIDVVSGNVDPLLIISGVALPGVGEGHVLTLSGRTRVRGGRADIAISSAAFDREPVRGALAITLGDPVVIGGSLEIGSFSLPVALAATLGSRPRMDGDLWPDKPFAAALPAGIAVDLDISARELDLGLGPIARAASLSLSHAGETTEIDELEAEFAGGRITGNLTSGIDDGMLEFALRARLEGADLAELVWSPNDVPVAAGLLTASIDFSGRGRSPSGLVSTLTGNGALTISEGTIRSVNPDAFTSIIRASDADPEMQEEELAAVFAGYLDAGALSFERASGSLGMAQGVLQLSTLSLGTETTTALASATVDFNDMTLDGNLSLKADMGDEKVTGSDPEVGIAFSGPLAAPVRAIDVGPLVGYLTVRAFERDVERIEALQEEIAERERRLGLRPPEDEPEPPDGPDSGVEVPPGETTGEGPADDSGPGDTATEPAITETTDDGDDAAPDGEGAAGPGSEAPGGGTTEVPAPRQPATTVPLADDAAPAEPIALPVLPPTTAPAAAEPVEALLARPAPQVQAQQGGLPPLDQVERDSLLTPDPPSPRAGRPPPVQQGTGGPLQLLPAANP